MLSIEWGGSITGGSIDEHKTEIEVIINANAYFLQKQLAVQALLVLRHWLEDLNE